MKKIVLLFCIVIPFLSSCSGDYVKSKEVIKNMTPYELTFVFSGNTRITIKKFDEYIQNVKRFKDDSFIFRETLDSIIFDKRMYIDMSEGSSTSYYKYFGKLDSQFWHRYNDKEIFYSESIFTIDDYNRSIPIPR